MLGWRVLRQPGYKFTKNALSMEKAGGVFEGNGGMGRMGQMGLMGPMGPMAANGGEGWGLMARVDGAIFARGWGYFCQGMSGMPVKWLM